MQSVAGVNIYQSYHRLFVDGVDAVDVNAKSDLGRTICDRQYSHRHHSHNPSVRHTGRDTRTLSNALVISLDAGYLFTVFQHRFTL